MVVKSSKWYYHKIMGQGVLHALKYYTLLHQIDVFKT